MKKSKITIDISFNENNIPEKISCFSSDDKKKKEIKSFMLSLWDSEKKETLKIDLWTKDMLLEEMKVFICQSILSVKHVAKRALDDDNLVNKIDKFSTEIAKEIGIVDQK